jgi:hypothetical protein
VGKSVRTRLDGHRAGRARCDDRSQQGRAGLSADDGEADPGVGAPATLAASARVAMPIGRASNPDLAQYAKAIGGPLARVRSPAALKAWIAANEPVYLADGIGPGIKARVLQMVTTRQREVGVPLPEPI